MHRVHMCVCVPETTTTTYIQTQNARTNGALVGVYVEKKYTNRHMK